ncbi:hypothetical protein B0I27_109101 [Arcticibacter pallidicorallinus]|uniref:Uncharacterized protein n=1 Tax=Arcticibacter pallidicorallinus TaxID=1259464 RepID=A0A2T0TXW7_9SPHI|nr:hypothetical protein B0I27_109101 [Arcticibacter pallidicorallinus]
MENPVFSNQSIVKFAQMKLTVKQCFVQNDQWYYKLYGFYKTSSITLEVSESSLLEYN